MTDNNTLLGRCTVAYAEAWNERIKTMGPAGKLEWPDDAQRQGVAAVLEHLAAELLVMNQRNERLSVHEVARIFRLEAAGELAGWDQDEEVAA